MSIGEVVKYISILTFLFFIFSCGVKLDLNDTKQNVVFGPDFEGAARFCEERYENEVDAEKCFTDYREYLNLTVGLDLTEIINYCESHYSTPEDIIGCEDQLTALLGGV